MEKKTGIEIMESKCQNPKCGKYFTSKTEKAMCCSSWCYTVKKQLAVCNIISHTTLNLKSISIDTMNQKKNYYKALQIAAAMTPRRNVLQ